MIHFLRIQIIAKDGFMSLKLDMNKAYNRLEWSYLEEVMLQMGFATLDRSSHVMCQDCFFFCFNKRRT